VKSLLALQFGPTRQTGWHPTLVEPRAGSGILCNWISWIGWWVCGCRIVLSTLGETKNDRFGPQIHEEHRIWGVAIRWDYSGIFPCEYALWILNPKVLDTLLVEEHHSFSRVW
jgi:hypothetical protein